MVSKLAGWEIFVSLRPKRDFRDLAEAKLSQSRDSSLKEYFLCPGSKVADSFVTAPSLAMPPPMPVLMVK